MFGVIGTSLKMGDKVETGVDAFDDAYVKGDIGEVVQGKRGLVILWPSGVKQAFRPAHNATLRVVS